MRVSSFFTGIFLAVILISSCKKKNELDPTIHSRVINKTITPIKFGNNFMFSDYLDIDNDGKLDVDFTGTLTDSIDVIQIQESNDSVEILSTIVSVEQFTYPTTKELTIGTLIDVSSSHWSKTSILSYINIKKGKELSFGIQGKGDVYIGIKIKKPDNNNYYAWMLLNVSADLNTIVVKEVGVNKILNEGIKVGEK